MDSESNSSIADSINVNLDCSDVYSSALYSELSKKVSEYEMLIKACVSEDLFADYREAQIDMEALFYKFGFLEGMKFAKSFTCASPKKAF